MLLPLVVSRFTFKTEDKQFSDRVADQKEAEEEITYQMTVESAFRTIKNMQNVSFELINTIEEQLSSLHLSHSKKRRTESTPATGYGGLATAKAKLNDMIHETAVKLDLELIRCSTYERSQLAYIEKLRQDISTFNAAASAAAAEMLRASAEISMYGTKIPQAKSELALLVKYCTDSMARYRRELRIVADDIKVMERIMAMTACNTPTMLLMQCVDPETGKTYMQLGNDTIQGEVNNLRHPIALNLLKEGLDEYPDDKEMESPVAKVFLQRDVANAIDKKAATEKSKADQDEVDDADETDDASDDASDSDDDSGSDTDGDNEDDDDKDDDKDDNHIAKSANQTPNSRVNDGAFLQQPLTTRAPNSTDPPRKSKLRAKCSIAASPACPKLRERFMDIASGIDDKRVQLLDSIRALQRKCNDGQTRLKSKIILFEQSLKKEEMALAQAASIKMNSEEQSRLTQVELTKATIEYNAMMATCRTNIATYRSEKCGLTKIRGELYKMQGQKMFFQDCEVSDWETEECTATCGGGTQKLTRQVTVNPNMGAACPKLSAVQSCNEEACPVDCVMEDWTRWTACSAECGGGVRSKARQVVTPAQHGGDPCTETSKTESCNIMACDVDCVLADWSAFGACSKACGSGVAIRTRDVRIPSIGQGKCPHSLSAKRAQSKPCNVQPCVNATVNVFKCEAKLDVILLLDGSGSLGQRGWEATRKAGQMLAAAMGPDVQFAAMLFSGPTTYPNLWACTGVSPNPNKALDMEKDCGIQWVSHFTFDGKSVADKIKNLQWPEKTTLTSLALSTAEAELTQGRQDASSLVIVITDGKPLSEWKTDIAAHSLRRKARLTWVPVGRLVSKKDIRRWASWPVTQNMVKVREFADLTQTATINQIISDTCPVIGTAGL